MKEYQVRFDGGLDLTKAEPLTDFSFPWLKTPCPETAFRAVWNGLVLSFRFDVVDDDLVLAEKEDPGEGALGSDRVEIFFASSADLESPYYGAEMDPSGRVYDYKATHYRNIDPGWSFSTLIFGGRIHESGYRVSGQIRIEELEKLDLLKG
ncbi:MAG: sugar-binding protein, partial [Verrucomicrobiota bacterium]